MLSAPEVATNAASEYLSQATQHGLDNDWRVHLYLATAAAAAGESADMDLHLEEATALLARSGSSGLPDILLPYTALARVVEEVELAQRWVTAMRHAGDRPGTGGGNCDVPAVARRRRTRLVQSARRDEPWRNLRRGTPLVRRKAVTVPGSGGRTHT